jgi:hypothetical protein
MCFNATASFTAAGFLLACGVINLGLLVFRHSARFHMNAAQRTSLALVAAVPLLFGAQQLSEGFVWQDFTNEVAIRCFAYTAYVFWPAYVAISFGLVEWTRRHRLVDQPPPVGWSYWPTLWQVRRRQQILAFNVVLACFLVSFVILEMIQNDPNTVNPSDGSLHYEGWGIDNQAQATTGSLIYLYCVIGTLIVSSLRYTTLFGVTVLASLILSVVLFVKHFESTWCFFSAILSIIVTWIVWNEINWYNEVGDEVPPPETTSDHHKKPPETTADPHKIPPETTTPDHHKSEIAIKSGCD